ncbi:MAG: HNH endonuclease [Pseudomonadota bacterium]
MKIKWPISKCIFCLENGDMTTEHVIPAALLGKLESKFLCKQCNSLFGRSFEATARADPIVASAVRALEESNPDLAATLLENQKVILGGQGGPRRGQVKKGVARIITKKLDDGSIITPAPEAKSHIMRLLQMDGHSPSVIEVALKAAQQAPLNRRISISPEIDVVTWSSDHVELDMSAMNIMSPLVPAKIAYEFLAGHLGDQIYDKSIVLDDIRAMFLKGEICEHDVSVERLWAKNNGLFHGICFEGNSPNAKVLIRLFGTLAFRVTFKRWAIGGARFVYTHMIATGEEIMRILGDNSAGPR